MKKRALVVMAVAVMLLASLVAVPLTASAEGPVPHVAIPQHPYMAPNGLSNMHNDGYMTDTYGVTGPNGTNPRVKNTGTAPRLAVTITFDQFGRLVVVVMGADGQPHLKLYDPDTLAELKSYALPGRPYPPEEDLLPITEDPSGGVYFYLDNNYNAVVATNDYRILEIQVPSADLSTGFQVVGQYDLSADVRDLTNDTPPDRDKLGPALSDWGGQYYWYTTRYGLVGLVDRATGAVQTYDLWANWVDGEEMQNSPAAAEDGFYVVSDYAMYRFSIGSGGTVALDWRTAYDRGTRKKPGMITQGCGPSPTIIGDLVAIADNRDPMYVLFLNRHTGALEASIPVFDGPRYDLGGGLYESCTENTLIGVQRDADNYSVIVENNYGYVTMDDVEGDLTLIGGVTRIDVVHSGGVYTPSKVWESLERSLTPVPKMSLANGLVYLYTKPPGPLWYLTAVDFETGATVFSHITGAGIGGNNNWAPITLGPDGKTVYVGTLGGLKSIRDYEVGEGCFIATAAYGTESAAEIDVLRAFRDDVLLESAVGSRLVEWYYQTSPPVADFIAENSLLKTMVRELVVDPITSLVEATMSIWGD